MEQLVRLQHTYDDGTAQVIRIRESACSGDCHKCSGCGAAQQTLIFRAVNAIGAKPGEMVIVKAESGPVLSAAAVMFVLPMVLFFLGYALGHWLWAQGGFAGGIAFCVGIALAVIYDRKVVKNQNMVYTITGYPNPGGLESQIKGDNDLD